MNRVPHRDFVGKEAATYVFPPDITSHTSGTPAAGFRASSLRSATMGSSASTAMASPMTPQQAQRRGRLDSTSSSAFTGAGGIAVPEGAVQPLSPVQAGGGGRSGSGSYMDLGDGSTGVAPSPGAAPRRSSLTGAGTGTGSIARAESGVISFGPDPPAITPADALRGTVPLGEDTSDYEMGPLETDLPPIPLTMKLKILHMKGCKLVTDTGLSWILQQHTEIRELNVKGSGVTKGSLIAAVHGSDSTSRGPCMLRDDAEWFGIYPRPRADDITREAEYQKQWTASIKIQALMRGFLARKRVLEMREAELKLWLAMKLQSIVRGARVRRVVKRERTNQIKKFYAILLIHRAWRRFKARKAMRTGQVRSIRDKMFSCVLTIQRMWRQMLRFKDEVAAAKADGLDHPLAVAKAGASSKDEALVVNPHAALDSKALALNSNRVTRDRTTGKRRQRVKYLRREAALDIQRVWRGYRTRQFIPYLRAQVEAYRAKRARSIMLIQVGFLTYIARIRARKRKEKRKKAAGTLVRWSLRVLARKWRKAEHARQRRGAIAFQKVWRGFVGRCIADEVRAECEAKRANEASSKIARWWRVRKTLAGLRTSAGIRMALRKGAIDLQRLYRGHRGRKRAFLYKSQRDLMRAKRSALLNWAATRLQCFWRKAMAAKMYRVLHEATIPLPLNSLAAGTALERMREKERNRLTQLATGLGYSLDASAAAYYQQASPAGSPTGVVVDPYTGAAYATAPASPYSPYSTAATVAGAGAGGGAVYSAMQSPGGFFPSAASATTPMSPGAMGMTQQSYFSAPSPQSTISGGGGFTTPGARAAAAVNYGSGPGGNEWSLETDPATGAQYYFNRFTGESRWLGT
jgi:IQ calmodulin-binding motif